jgi:hypothetical protein
MVLEASGIQTAVCLQEVSAVSVCEDYAGQSWVMLRGGGERIYVSRPNAQQVMQRLMQGE